VLGSTVTEFKTSKHQLGSSIASYCFMTVAYLVIILDLFVYLPGASMDRFYWAALSDDDFTLTTDNNCFDDNAFFTDFQAKLVSGGWMIIAVIQIVTLIVVLQETIVNNCCCCCSRNNGKQ